MIIQGQGLHLYIWPSYACSTLCIWKVCQLNDSDCDLASRGESLKQGVLSDLLTPQRTACQYCTPYETAQLQHLEVCTRNMLFQCWPWRRIWRRICVRVHMRNEALIFKLLSLSVRNVILWLEQDSCIIIYIWPRLQFHHSHQGLNVLTWKLGLSYFWPLMLSHIVDQEWEFMLCCGIVLYLGEDLWS